MPPRTIKVNALHPALDECETGAFIAIDFPEAALVRHWEPAPEHGGGVSVVIDPRKAQGLRNRVGAELERIKRLDARQAPAEGVDGA